MSKKVFEEVRNLIVDTLSKVPFELEDIDVKTADSVSLKLVRETPVAVDLEVFAGKGLYYDDATIADVNPVIWVDHKQKLNEIVLGLNVTHDETAVESTFAVGMDDISKRLNIPIDATMFTYGEDDTIEVVFEDLDEGDGFFISE